MYREKYIQFQFECTVLVMLVFTTHYSVRPIINYYTYNNCIFVRLEQQKNTEPPRYLDKYILIETVQFLRIETCSSVKRT